VRDKVWVGGTLPADGISDSISDSISEIDWRGVVLYCALLSCVVLRCIALYCFCGCEEKKQLF
jgi:hypothetical protein